MKIGGGWNFYFIWYFHKEKFENMTIMRPKMTKNKYIIYIVQMASRFVVFVSFFDGTEEKMKTLFHLLSL